ncbi:uncharacterized protein ARMOST_20937 [Armillaria ostoyae]|uniref:Reverse transcriptase domain-containing protein n=1 Tax=Armillaria ostoyae TaxID=47428 RepID=A0A284S8P0_ARMOS|nr:uncharacterized protein ARMOST_20937 [Armillaria ostoyae]
MQVDHSSPIGAQPILDVHTVLAIEEYNDNDKDTTLKGSNDRLPARVQAKVVNPTGHRAESPIDVSRLETNRYTSSLCGETQPAKVSDDKSPTIVTFTSTASSARPGRAGDPGFALTPEEAAAQEQKTARSTLTRKDTNDAAGVATFPPPFRGIMPTNPSDPLRPEVAGWTGNSMFTVRVQPVVLTVPAVQKGDTSVLDWQIPHPDTQKKIDEDRQECPSKTAGDANATAMKKIAAGQEAASAQAVNRGHRVTLIEVPNEEDDTAFLIWMARQTKSKQPSPVAPLAPTITRGWCQPFEVDWTLCTISNSPTNSSPHYGLRERWHENSSTSCEKPRTTFEAETAIVTTSCSIGCTSSAINHAFVKKHELNTVKTAIPIIVYNADGTRNKAGDITEFVEFRMTIRNHSERIDFTVTDLGSKDLYLGHDWLKHHNPVINWNMGSITFGHCQCIKNPFPLPDADPEDRWDEELKEGNTILTVNMEEEVVIRAIYHANDLAAAANAEKPKKTFEEMENFDELPERRPWDHAIELIPNAKLTLDCKKKDGSLHPVQDYRKLNEMTIKNRYPLPLISDVIDKLQGAKYFTKLDVRWGYNNVRIKEGDEEKAAFRMNHGLFEPTVMFFRLTNSPATFQWMMNDIFKDLIASGKVTIYLDDILIFTRDLDEHRRILFLKAEKCEFEVLETEYLGVIISEGSVRMDPVKVAGITEWPTPLKKKELQLFLGFTNFYQKFIKNYSKIVCPLTLMSLDFHGNGNTNSGMRLGN